MDLWGRLYQIFEKLPKRLRHWLRHFVSSPLSLRWLVLYALIGIGGVMLYLLVLWCLLRLRVQPILATALTYILVAAAQFIFNRNANFRAFHGTITQQAGTYAVIVAAVFLVTIAIVTIAIHIGHLTPFAANIVAICVIAPLSYLLNRYVTFAAHE